jgi:hypothetical protein
VTDKDTGRADKNHDNTTESESTVSVDFKAADGSTYKGRSPEGVVCPICDRLITEHSKDEVRECAHKDRDRRFPQLRDVEGGSHGS